MRSPNRFNVFDLGLSIGNAVWWRRALNEGKPWIQCQVKLREAQGQKAWRAPDLPAQHLS
jgi:hypothetical protein